MPENEGESGQGAEERAGVENRLETLTEGGAKSKLAEVLGGEEFSIQDAIGGWRGLIESIAPGLAFVVVFVITGELTPPLVASLAMVVIAVTARLVRRSNVTQALAGAGGVVIGAIWAWKTGEARDYFAWGLWVNVGYLVGTALTMLIRWPVVGLLVALFRGDLTGWRKNPVRMRRAQWATGLWVIMFAARLVIQLPLYFGDDTAWLGTAKLVMGVPLFALVLWISWLLVREPADRAAAPPSASQ